MADVQSKIKSAVNHLVDASHPLKIILFGSQARHDATEDSDIDLMVVVDQLKDKEAETMALYRALWAKKYTPMLSWYHRSILTTGKKRPIIYAMKPSSTGRYYMTKHLRENAERYLQKTTEDEKLLKAILNLREVSKEIFGFHAQQAIEKLLKAVLTICDILFGNVHDLRRLIDEFANAERPIPSTLTKIDLLTPYGVVGRYDDVPFKHLFSRSELQGLIRQLR